jgi:superfamily II DNA or RNA helicase
VLVGTHQALDQIRRTALEDGGLCQLLLDRIQNTFDLIIVDEGHYEPAASWSRGVRDFNLPTVLLSATPYRNDYKSFRVRGRFLFNYPHADAVRDRIIRPVEIIVSDDKQATDAKNAVSRFATLLRSELPARLASAGRWFKDKHTLPKIMVRADDLDTLEALQAAINVAFDTRQSSSTIARRRATRITTGSRRHLPPS